MKHFRHFFFEQEYGWLLLLFFFLERERWITPAHGHRRKRSINWTETRSLHSQHYLTSFFLRARVSVSLVPGRSLLIRCPREVSVTSQRMVESRNDRAENAWGLGWVIVLSWIWTGPRAQQVWAREPAKQWLQACISMRWLFWFKTNGKDTDIPAGMLKNNRDSAISGKFWRWIRRCLPRHRLSKRQSLSTTVLRSPGLSFSTYFWKTFETRFWNDSWVQTEPPFPVAVLKTSQSSSTGDIIKTAAFCSSLFGAGFSFLMFSCQ